MTNIVERLKEYAGKDRRDVSNPCMTAREAIVVADHIISIEAKLAAAESEVARLSALVPRWVSYLEHEEYADSDAPMITLDGPSYDDDCYLVCFGPFPPPPGEMES